MNTPPALTPDLLLSFMRSLLEDVPLGLLLLDSELTPIWYNREAAIACAIWNRCPCGADTLPLADGPLIAPEPVLAAARELLTRRVHPSSLFEAQVADADRGLHARVRRDPVNGRIPFHIQIDYRRPRGDRDRPLSPRALVLFNRLSFREREVALRVRDGLTTNEIASELQRSPLTVKTQLAGIFSKLGVRNRARVAAILNR